MSLRYILILFAAISAVTSTEVGPVLGKRAQLEGRQSCRTPGWIPACPGTISQMNRVLSFLAY
jgi:hypothetical protein